MYLVELFFVSILPGFFWVWYFYRQDYLDPEPWTLIIRSFLLGGLAVIPVTLIETPFAGQINQPASVLQLFLLLILVVGFSEEIFKFLGAYVAVVRNHEFNEVMDGIIYVVTAGLGFAAVENVIYTTVYGSRVGIVRAVVTSLAHAGFSGIAGYYFGMARCYPEKRGFYIGFGLIVASILHGLYDFMVMTQILNFVTTLLVVLFLQFFLARLIRQAEHLSPFK